MRNHRLLTHPIPSHSTFFSTAAREDALLVTTSKDFARMCEEERAGVEVLPVSVQWVDGDEDELNVLVDRAILRR